MRRAAFLGPCFGLIVALFPRGTQASPPIDLPVSNEAAMMGGTVLAGGRSAGSFWYNPALLGRVDHSETEANAEVVGGRITRADEGVAVTRADGSVQTAALRSSEFLAVPTTVAGVFSVLENLRVGYGLFVPSTSDVDVGATIESSGPSGDEIFELRHRRASSRYQGALGIAWKSGPGMLVGASVLGTFDQTRREQRLFAVRAGPDTPGRSALIDEDTTVGTAGISLNVGLRGRLHRLVHGAVTVATPAFVVFQSVDGQQVQAQVSPEDSETAVTDVDPEVWSISQLSGWRVGTGLTVGERGWLVGTDVYASTGSSGEGPLSTRPSVGASVGGRFDVAKRVSMGFGAFFRGNAEKDDSFGTPHTDQVGGSAGLEIRRKLELADRRNIEFRTVVAAWYAHGWGTLSGLRVTSTTDSVLDEVRTADTPATTHLILLHLGSSIAY